MFRDQYLSIDELCLWFGRNTLKQDIGRWEKDGGLTILYTDHGSPKYKLGQVIDRMNKEYPEKATIVYIKWSTESQFPISLLELTLTQLFNAQQPQYIVDMSDSSSPSVEFQRLLHRVCSRRVGEILLADANDIPVVTLCPEELRLLREQQSTLKISTLGIEPQVALIIRCDDVLTYLPFRSRFATPPVPIPLSLPSDQPSRSVTSLVSSPSSSIPPNQPPKRELTEKSATLEKEPEKSGATSCNQELLKSAEEYVDFGVVAKEYNISLEILTELVKRGRVDVIKYNGQLLYALQDVKDHIKAEKVAVGYIRVCEDEVYSDRVRSFSETTKIERSNVFCDRGKRNDKIMELLSKIKMGEVSRVVIEDIYSLEPFGPMTFLMLCGTHHVPVIIDNSQYLTTHT